MKSSEKMHNIKLSNKIFELDLNAKELSIYAYLCSLPLDYPMFDGTAVKNKKGDPKVSIKIILFCSDLIAVQARDRL